MKLPFHFWVTYLQIGLQISPDFLTFYNTWLIRFLSFSGRHYRKESRKKMLWLFSVSTFECLISSWALNDFVTIFQANCQSGILMMIKKWNHSFSGSGEKKRSASWTRTEERKKVVIISGVFVSKKYLLYERKWSVNYIISSITLNKAFIDCVWWFFYMLDYVLFGRRKKGTVDKV